MRNKLNEGLLFTYYGGLLNEHQQEVLHSYYDCDMSLAEISEYLHISRQAVRDTIVRSNAKLTEYENKLSLISKIKDIATDFESILLHETFSESQKRELLSILNRIKEI